MIAHRGTDRMGICCSLFSQFGEFFLYIYCSEYIVSISDIQGVGSFVRQFGGLLEIILSSGAVVQSWSVGAQSDQFITSGSASDYDWWAHLYGTGTPHLDGEHRHPYQWYARVNLV